MFGYRPKKDNKTSTPPGPEDKEERYSQRMGTNPPPPYPRPSSPTWKAPLVPPSSKTVQVTQERVDAYMRALAPLVMEEVQRGRLSFLNVEAYLEDCVRTLIGASDSIAAKILRSSSD